MNRANQETVTTFAEVLSTAGISCHQAGRPAMPDSRPMIYFQDGFQPETLLKLLRVMRQL